MYLPVLRIPYSYHMYKQCVQNFLNLKQYRYLILIVPVMLVTTGTGSDTFVFSNLTGQINYLILLDPNGVPLTIPEEARQNSSGQVGLQRLKLNR